jgi:putative SOS response-associated peptidase YedK
VVQQHRGGFRLPRVGSEWEKAAYHVRAIRPALSVGEIHRLHALAGASRDLQAHYNVAPTDDVIRPVRDGTTELVSMRWGSFPTGGASG